MSWKVVEMKEIAPAKTAKVDPQRNGEVWNITLDQIESNTGRISNKQYIPISQASQSTNFVNENNVLYSKLRPNLNKVVIADEFAIATSEMIPLYPDKERLSAKYLLYFLRSNRFVTWASVNVTGAKMPRTDMKQFWKYSIPLPPLEQQHRIVELLDRAQALIDKRKEQIALMDQLIQSLFYDMFGDPVTNPMEWEKTKFNNLLTNIDSGWSPKCLQHSKTDDQWGVLKLSAVTGGIYRSKENKQLPVNVSPRMNLEVRAHDLLFTRKNTKDLVGACAYVFDTPPKLMFPDIIFRFATNDKIDKIYLWILFNHSGYRELIASLAGGSAASMINISKAKLKELLIPLPSYDLQLAFASKVQKILSQKQAMTNSLQELEDNFNSISQRAFKGEL